MIFMVSKVTVWEPLEAESFEDARKQAAGMATGAQMVNIGVLDDTQNIVKLAETIHVEYDGDVEWHGRPH